jgi:hypothetical protein
MPTDSMQPTRKTPIGLMIAVLLIVTALVLGYVIGVTKGQKSGYAAGEAAARQSAETPIAPGGGVVMEQLSMTGTVKEVRADGFVMETQPGSGGPRLRTVTLAAGGTVTIATLKDQAVYLAEMEAYRASAETSSPDAPNPPPPAPFTVTAGTLADLKADMTVTVLADTDISRAEAITATEVSARPPEPVFVPPQRGEPVLTDTPTPAPDSPDGTPIENSGNAPMYDEPPSTPIPEGGDTPEPVR